MSDELTKPISTVDGFEGFEDRHEGDERPQGVIQGTIVKFTNESTWVTRDKEELPSDLELIALNVSRVVQKWVDQLPVETRILEPGEKFPDLEELNAKAPKSEWTKKFDKLCGPWQAQYIVYLLDPKTMDRYSFPTSTDGGGIAVRELREKVLWMRKLRGQNVYAVVTLSNKFFKTGYGGRQRPHFVIVRWITLGAEEKTALPAPAQEVKEPTLAEEMNDAIPDFSTPASTAAAPETNEMPKAEVKEVFPGATKNPSGPKAAAKPRMTKKGVQKIAGNRTRAS